MVIDPPRAGIHPKTIPIIIDKVTTLVGPGDLIDVIVTERGIAINPKRTDLIKATKKSSSSVSRPNIPQR